MITSTANLNTIVPLDRSTPLSVHQEADSPKAVVDGDKNDICVVHNVLAIIQMPSSITLHGIQEETNTRERLCASQLASVIHILSAKFWWLVATYHLKGTSRNEHHDRKL